MNVKVTTFRNPFSFFCVCEETVTYAKDIALPESTGLQISTKVDFSGVTHGQYVAVMWNSSWARGIITLETQFRIWLVDYGIYMRPNDKTIYVNLPAEDKKIPSKVFEASIHGAVPLEKVFYDGENYNKICEIKNKQSTTWNNGAIQKTQELLVEADKTYFVPIAMLSTNFNDVVIGDLYLQTKGKRVINLVDELQKWPVFLNRDPEIYIKNLSKFYTHRRQHRASLSKPVFPDFNLPTMTLETTLNNYLAICASSPELQMSYNDSDEEGSTITYLEKSPVNREAYKLTPAEIEKYSDIYITVSGRQLNVLNILLNKARDLYICEKYQNLKSLGRANSRVPRNESVSN